MLHLYDSLLDKIIQELSNKPRYERECHEKKLQQELKPIAGSF